MSNLAFAPTAPPGGASARKDETSRHLLFALLALFFSVFLICAGLLQLRSRIAPQTEGGPLDQMNGALLWATSLMGLFIASARQRADLRCLFWLCVSAGFAALAIDEVFQFHEGTRFSVGDDDYIKIAAWGCALSGAYVICRVAQPTRTVIIAFVIALTFQTLWLLSDMGDGDFFTVPLVPLQTLYWIEEYLEIMASMFYLTALFVHYRDDFATASVQHAWQVSCTAPDSSAAPGASAAATDRVAA